MINEINTRTSFDNFLKFGWILVGESAFFNSKIKKETIHQLELIFFRNSLGDLKCFHARCPHMGIDLSKGHFNKNHLICPFHKWVFNEDGKCVSIPGCTNPLDKQKSLMQFKSKEVMGLVFISHPDFQDELPFFEEINSKNAIRSKMFQDILDLNWFALSINAFDIAHLTTYHNRVLTKASDFIEVNSKSRKITHYYLISGSTLGDKILRFFNKGESNLAYQCWNGYYSLAVLSAGKVKNYMMFYLNPISKESTNVKIVIFSKAGKIKIFTHLKLYIQTILTLKFFRNEAEIMKGINVKEESLGPLDTILSKYIKWAKDFGLSN